MEDGGKVGFEFAEREPEPNPVAES
jgi:hypothetical protein